MARSKWARVMSLTSPPIPIPALLNIRSRCPWSLAVRSTSSLTASGSLTSRPAADARPGGPACSSSDALCAPISSRSANTTDAPRAERADAMARPIPEAAPVTIATLPSKRVSVGIAAA